MANIVSSTFTSFVQKDGSKTVHEVHTDLIGLTHDIVYTAAAGDDLNAAMATHANNLGNSLANNEVASNLSNAETLGKNANGINVTIYSTAAQNIAALTAAWPTMLNIQAIFVGEYLSTLSDAVLQSVFGWSPAYEQTVRTNFLTPYATLAASIRTATGTS